MHRISGVLTVAAVLAFPLTGHATLYSDATGDLHDGTGGGTDFSGFTHLDIDTVEVTDDGTTLTFDITLVGDIVATNWGKYTVGIDTGPGGDTAGNGWGRPISMSSGMDFWIGSWVDGGGGAQLFSWNGASWDLISNPTHTINTNTLTLSTTLTALGLTAGESFDFDVYSTAGGGGDGAVDALATGSVTITDWGNSYDSGSNVESYTTIPEPASLALLGLGGLVMLRRRK